jgi:S-adenosylmethionine/arginine decarboxylase-like enzyme
VKGNRGLTCVAIIETSHIALHVWDESAPALMQLDVYTCGQLDPYQVVEALKIWEPVKVEMKYLDREHGLIELPLEKV